MVWLQHVKVFIKYLRQLFNITERELILFLGTKIKRKSDGSFIMHQGLFVKKY